jgi:hypothetical protein
LPRTSHTHEVTKNYFHRCKLGAHALWDVATDTGEVATAVLVPSMKTSDYSHAAIQLSQRSNFNPTAIYSDTWPCKSNYWDKLFTNNLQGRLGLFHFLQRIIKTLRKGHIDYFSAVNQLLDSVYYYYNKNDYENLLRALKDGTLSSAGIRYTDDEIADMKLTKTFRKRYGKYLRKHIRPPESMKQQLEEWFVRFKSSSSDGAVEALGRIDPISKQTLFTAETKDAIRNCKEKANHLQDPFPIEKMYHVILPNPNSAHRLNIYLS